MTRINSKIQDVTSEIIFSNTNHTRTRFVNYRNGFYCIFAIFTVDLDIIIKENVFKITYEMNSDSMLLYLIIN